MPSVSRRTVAGAALTLTALAAAPAAQAAAETRAEPFAAGPLPVDRSRSGVVALLLPAAPKTIEPARLQVIDGFGQIAFETAVALDGDAATARTYDLFEPRWVPGEGGPPAFLAAGIRCRETGEIALFSSPSQTLTVRLLPAVQRGGATVPPIAASFQSAPATDASEQPNRTSPLLIPVPGSPDAILPLTGPSGGDALAFGPATLADGEALLLSFSLPGVPNAQSPARIEIHDAAGGLLLREAPDPGTVYQVAFADGSVRVFRQGDTRPVAVAVGSGTVAATLLPAVQRGGREVPALSGILRTARTLSPAAIIPCI